MRTQVDDLQEFRLLISVDFRRTFLLTYLIKRWSEITRLQLIKSCRCAMGKPPVRELAPRMTRRSTGGLFALLGSKIHHFQLRNSGIDPINFITE